MKGTIVKNALVVGAVLFASANVASAQGMEIHSRWGDSGTQIALPADTQCFNYEATITGGVAAYMIVLDVYHNGVLKEVHTQVVLWPRLQYKYSVPVELGCWGLATGDTVTFKCRVVGLNLGNLLATHTLTGNVVPPGAPLP